MTRIPTPNRQFQSRDFKLLACLEYAHHSWNIHRAPKNKELIPIANFFRGRCARLRGLMLMPATIGDLTIKMQRAMDLAEFEITKQIAEAGPSSDFHDQITARWQELLYEHAKANAELRKTPQWDGNVLRELTSGLKPTDIMVADVAASRALEASLMSYVTTAWTIVETMCGDLWEAAMNSHPASLANLNGKSNRLRKTKSERPNIAGGGAARESKTVPLDSIAMHGFDVRNKMGTILRFKFEFSSLEGIREAYASAFDRDFGQIDHALTNISLDALSAVRNVIVHKDGVADAEYLQKMKFMKSIPRAELGDHILLDGEIVVSLLKPAVTAANQLLVAVDEWMTKHGD